MIVSVVNIEGKDTGRTVNLDETIYGIEPNDHAIYLDVKSLLANRRHGTHKAKQRAEINATTKKLKKQKGTGGARAGSMKSPLFVGGGRVFGPVPRDYSIKVNKKVKELARRSALAHKAKANKIVVVEDFDFSAPKTKSFITMLNNLTLSNVKSLLVLGENKKNVILSGRNLPSARTIVASDLNTYDVLHADTLVVSEKAIEKINTLLSN
jgi:large subunit ribosomal protein L4